MARRMKDSGVEWIGEIPEDWNTYKVINQFDMVGSGTTPKSYSDDYYTNGTINWIQSGDLHEKYLKSTSKKITQAAVNETSALKLYTPKYLVMAMYGASVGNLVISTIEACTNQACCVLAKEKGNLEYMYYVLMVAKEYLIYSAVGGTQSNISQSIIKDLRVPVPYLGEQKKITEFLDEKVEEIDSVIVKIKETIEDYKKYKQTIITDAVTKGLNPDVEMKESNVEWIGEIPKHWEIVKAKNVVVITNGSDPKTEGDIPVYGSGAKSFKTCGEFKEGPTVLIGRKGATLHIPHYIDERYWNVDTAFDVKGKDGKISLKYYYYTAICFDYRKFISQTTLPSMTQTDYGNMYIPYPNRNEQNIIVEYLDGQCLKIDKLITKKEKLLVDLESYKKSLIYEYVTGKKQFI